MLSMSSLKSLYWSEKFLELPYKDPPRSTIIKVYTHSLITRLQITHMLQLKKARETHLMSNSIMGFRYINNGMESLNCYPWPSTPVAVITPPPIWRPMPRVSRREIVWWGPQPIPTCWRWCTTMSIVGVPGSTTIRRVNSARMVVGMNMKILSAAAAESWITRTSSNMKLIHLMSHVYIFIKILIMHAIMSYYYLIRNS